MIKIIAKDSVNFIKYDGKVIARDIKKGDIIDVPDTAISIVINQGKFEILKNTNIVTEVVESPKLEEPEVEPEVKPEVVEKVAEEENRIEGPKKRGRKPKKGE